MSIAIVNRYRIDTINVNVDIDNYLDPYTNYTANVYTLGGSGYTWDSTNLEDPDNVVPQQSQISFTGGDFTYSAEPLSITIIEVSTIQPQSYHFAYTGEISPGVYGVHRPNGIPFRALQDTGSNGAPLPLSLTAAPKIIPPDMPKRPPTVSTGQSQMATPYTRR